MKHTKQEIATALEDLKRWIKPGTVIYTINLDGKGYRATHTIKVVIFNDGIPLFPQYQIGVLLDMSLNREGTGVKVGASGMDAGSHLVGRLSLVLFGQEFQLLHQNLA